MSKTTEQDDAAGQQRGIVHQQYGRWPGDQERKPIADAVRELWEIGIRDCYGSEASDHGKPCTCETCIVKKAIEALEGVLYPVVRSLRPERLEQGFPEMMFFEAWKETNKRVRFLNYGRGTLEHLIEELGPVTQRDMDVATAVVQWLGTNVGGCFLREVQQQIERVHQEGRKLINERLGRIHGEPDKHGITRPVTV